jgi:hypothetical protein
VTGLEPASEFVLNDDDTCSCEICQTLRAANALQSECILRHFLALIDAELAKVIAAWPTLAELIRKAILLLIDATS